SFARSYGFKGDRLPTEGFLTFDRLDELGAALDLCWRITAPGSRWRPLLNRWRARIRGRREPAAFPLAIGQLGRAPAPRAAWPGLARAAARLFLRARLRLLQRGRYNRLVLEQVHGTPILVLPGVFNPKLLRTGAFLVQVLDRRSLSPDATVLDLGTGSGVGAVFAGRRARRVVAVDVNPEAVRCARLNFLLHHLGERCEAREGDLFGPVEGERFDLVLFNPPFYRGEPRDALDRAWRATDVIERFAARLGDHLEPGGVALVILSSDGEAAGFLSAVRANGLAVELVAWRDLVNETLAVYQIKLTPPLPDQGGGLGAPMPNRCPTTAPESEAIEPC
ncbi:MAG TPA: methyltransferase, partial [Chloroflexota bacterium]|nr:methyltransferase [Chloroflexota bacterium]